MLWTSEQLGSLTMVQADVGVLPIHLTMKLMSVLLSLAAVTSMILLLGQLFTAGFGSIIVMLVVKLPWT